MALDATYIIVIVLVSVVVILVATIGVVALALVYRRRLLCFKRRLDQNKLLQSDLERYGPVRKKHKQKQTKLFDRKKAKRKARRNKKRAKYHSLGKAPRFPKSDPFTNKFLENPLIADDEFDMDWTNPAFDREAAQRYDAAIIIQSWYRMIRVQVPYLQLRDATILAQSVYRGLVVRRLLPQLKKEKQQRDHQRKKQAGWKKKGTLAALKFYDVKGYGFAEVEQMYGLDTTRAAAEQLKTLYGGKGQMKLKLFISVKGIKLFDHYSMKHYATVKVSSVSFCTLDPKNKKLFAFINKKKRRKFCHVFQANEHDAQKMVETMAEAFEFTYKRVEQKREQKERERLAQVQKKRALNRQSKELDVEVASMIELAETASIATGSLKRPQKEEAAATGSLKRPQKDEAASSHSETSLTKSTENLITKASSERHSQPQRKTSGLVVTQKGKQSLETSERHHDSQKLSDVHKLVNNFEKERRGPELKTKSPPS